MGLGLGAAEATHLKKPSTAEDPVVLSEWAGENRERPTGDRRRTVWLEDIGDGVLEYESLHSTVLFFWGGGTSSLKEPL